jgi:hypothetical protein
MERREKSAALATDANFFGHEAALPFAGFGCRRARLSALARCDAFGFKSGTILDLSGCAVGSAAASNFPSAARSGSRRGAWGNLSEELARFPRRMPKRDRIGAPMFGPGNRMARRSSKKD